VAAAVDSLYPEPDFEREWPWDWHIVIDIRNENASSSIRSNISKPLFRQLSKDLHTVTAPDLQTITVQAMKDQLPWVSRVLFISNETATGAVTAQFRIESVAHDKVIGRVGGPLAPSLRRDNKGSSDQDGCN